MNRLFFGYFLDKVLAHQVTTIDDCCRVSLDLLNDEMLVVFEAIVRLVQNFIQYAIKEKACPEREDNNHHDREFTYRVVDEFHASGVVISLYPNPYTAFISGMASAIFIFLRKFFTWE